MYILWKLSTVDKDNGTISSNELSDVALITSFKDLIGVSVELSVSIFATVDIGCVIIYIFIVVNDDVNTFTIPVLIPVIIVLFNVDTWNSTELSPVTLVDINWISDKTLIWNSTVVEFIIDIKLLIDDSDLFWNFTLVTEFLPNDLGSFFGI